jgi:hypothetical protein
MKIRKKVIFIAGHPYAGKTTAAAIINRLYGGRADIHYFAKPLKEIAHRLAGAPDYVGFDYFEGSKDIPSPMMPLKANGQHFTPREFYIHVDRMLKAGGMNEAQYGNIMCIKNIMPSLATKGLIIIPDSGFPEAAAPVINLVGSKNCIKIQMERNLTNLPNDSRSLWGLPDLKTRVLVNRDLSELPNKLSKIVCEFILS